MMMEASTRRPWFGGQAVLSEVLTNRGFVWCALLLGLFTAGFEVLAFRKGISFNKQALHLKAPLADLDQTKLAPYRLLRPGVLEPNMIDQLGTNEYVQWLMGDSSGGRETNRIIRLFVTYYTGKPDPVPHIPETCLAGSGFQLLDKDLESVTVNGPQGQIEVPIQVLQFERHGLLGPSRQVIIYTFHANGGFHPSREAVRLVVNDPRTMYAYFSKLEIAVDIGEGYRTAEEATEAGKRFLKVVVPVLLSDHWPNWAEASGATEPAEHKTGQAQSQPA